jgi:hypothetical protein
MVTCIPLKAALSLDIEIRWITGRVAEPSGKVPLTSPGAPRGPGRRYNLPDIFFLRCSVYCYIPKLIVPLVDIFIYHLPLFAMDR